MSELRKSYRSHARCSEGYGTFDVSKLRGRSVDDDGENTTRGLFQEQVSTRAKEAWKNGGTVEEKWSALRSALTESAQSVLGIDHRRHPDWFREKAAVLKPLLEQRNLCYIRWLSSKRESDKVKFAKARRDARRAIREAKNEWFQEKAADAQRGKLGGNIVWRCIRDIQRGRRGLVPVRSAVVSTSVITGMGLLCWMLWGRQLQEYCRIDSRCWQKKCFLSHSVASGKDEDAWIWCLQCAS